MDKVFSSANILLPKNTDMTAWSVVACDQHTSDESYWQTLKNLVGDKPSTLNLIVPEVYLKQDVEKLIENANSNMRKLQNSQLLQEHKDCIIYVERQLSNGKVRKGLVGKIDLEQYSVDISKNAKIKPSEQIVASRVPTRVKIRNNASLDIPHILLFCNDTNREIIENIHSNLTPQQKVYDFNLNMNGGKITGYKLSLEQTKDIEQKMNLLISKCEAGIIVADGNHSLVAAKQVYEEEKLTNPNYLNSPKRYALAEIVNIYDESIEIEPIHRVLKNVDCEHLFNEIKNKLGSYQTKNSNAEIEIIFNGNEINLPIELNGKLPVERVQEFLDDYLTNNSGEIDYIHELDKLKDMCKEKQVLGIVFKPIAKEDVFKIIESKKLFPRKTFSIGTSLDKRYYLESRSLI